MKFRIGTRRSRLALAQAGEVAAALGSADHTTELVPIVTSGDRGMPASGSPTGVKGLFVAEIVRALQAGEVDLAVHSAKDLPARDDEGVAIAAVPRRANPFDVLVTRDAELPHGGAVGTSSVRRSAQWLRANPDARMVDIRGNVDTRLRKLADGEVDGLILAAAGLQRLGVTPAHAAQLSLVPAPGQGALAVQSRVDDDIAREALAPLDHKDSRASLEAERALMAALGGGCALPLGAYAHRDRADLAMVAIVISPDGTRIAKAEVRDVTPIDLAARAEEQLRAAGADEILDEVRA